jgi:hypothetical protein
MQRRKFMVGLGSLAAGGAAAIGTGAFSQSQTGREVKVSVVDDSSGFVAFNSTSPYSGTDGGELEIYFNKEAAAIGSGVPEKTTMLFEEVFAVENQGTQRVQLGLDQIARGSEQEFNIQPPGSVGTNGFEENKVSDDTSFGDRIDVGYSTETSKAFNQGPGTNDPDGDESIELDPGESETVDFAIRTDDDDDWFDGDGLATLVITTKAD